MAYRFELAESIDDALHRVGDEELASSIALLSSSEHSVEHRVHEVRKHLKKMRALFELVESSVDQAELSEATRRIRAAARSLAALRDRTALVETFEALVEHRPDALSPAAISRLQHALGAESNAESEEQLASLSHALAESRTRLAELRVTRAGWNAVERGFRRTYKRARSAYARARLERSAERLHAFRTPAKRHLYQIHLLEAVWSEPLRALRRELSQLGELLGQHHDLSLLGPVLEREELAADAESVRVLATGRRAELERDVFELGARLFAERPRALSARFGVYFETATHTDR